MTASLYFLTLHLLWSRADGKLVLLVLAGGDSCLMSWPGWSQEIPTGRLNYQIMSGARQGHEKTWTSAGLISTHHCHCHLREDCDLSGLYHWKQNPLHPPGLGRGPRRRSGDVSWGLVSSSSQTEPGRCHFCLYQTN